MLRMLSSGDMQEWRDAEDVLKDVKVEQTGGAVCCLDVGPDRRDESVCE